MTRLSLSTKARCFPSKGVALLLPATLLALSTAAGCTYDSKDYAKGDIDFEPERPNIDDPDLDVEAVDCPADLSTLDECDPVQKSLKITCEAQESLRTGIEFHQKVIWRTCTPNGGVCHNSKEYPDLRTPASFAAAFGAPCNVQSESTAIFNRCEPPGDRFTLNTWNFDADDIEIGYVEYIPGLPEEYDGEPPAFDGPGLHVILHDPLVKTGGENNDTWGTASFTRKFVYAGDVQESTFAFYDNRWWIVNDPNRPFGTHLVAEVPSYRVDAVEELMAVGLQEGDGNRDGIYGAREGQSVHQLVPGSPETSYLIARLRGDMEGETVPGTRMPLANQPLNESEMLAFFCLIEQFPEGGDETGLMAPIDYANCGSREIAGTLNLLGEGTTWEGRVKKLLAARCGGCHGGDEPREGLRLIEDPAYGNDVFADLVGVPSQQIPTMNLIEPGDPMNSYLFLKMLATEDEAALEAIKGDPMPDDSSNGENPPLTSFELTDIRTWIEQGAMPGGGGSDGCG
jgi:hypothetical protein